MPFNTDPIAQMATMLEQSADPTCATKIVDDVITIFKDQCFNMLEEDRKCATFMVALAVLVGSSGAVVSQQDELPFYNAVLMELIDRNMDDTEEMRRAA